VDDLADQVEGVVGGEAEPDERDVRVLPRGDRAEADLGCGIARWQSPMSLLPAPR
jgi:hypothetical protein